MTAKPTNPNDPANRPPSEPWKICLIVHTTAGQAHAVREEIGVLEIVKIGLYHRGDSEEEPT